MGYQVRQTYTVSQEQVIKVKLTRKSVTEHYDKNLPKQKTTSNFHFYICSKQLRSISMFRISGLKINR